LSFSTFVNLYICFEKTVCESTGVTFEQTALPHNAVRSTIFGYGIFYLHPVLHVFMLTKVCWSSSH